MRLDPTLRAPGRGAAGSGATQHTLPRSTPRAQTRKHAPLSRRYRAFPWAREPNQTHTGTEGDPGNWAGRCCGRPSIRPDRPRPMRTDGPGRDGLRAISLHFMHKQTWLSPRFDSDITCACSAVEIRVQIGQNSRSAHLCKHPSNVRVALTNGCKYMHETKFEMGADLLSSLGSRLKSPRFKFRALALAPSTEMKS